MSTKLVLQAAAEETQPKSDMSNDCPGQLHQGFISYLGDSSTPVRMWAVLNNSMVLDLYTVDKRELQKQIDLSKCQTISCIHNKDNYSATFSMEDEIQVISTKSDNEWVKIFDSFFDNGKKSDEETEDVFPPQRKISDCDGSLDNLQKALQAEIKRIEIKRGGLGLKVAAITNKYDRAQLAAKQEALRHQTALKMRKISTQLKIDSMHDYLKKQLKKNQFMTSAPISETNSYLEKQMEELRGELDAINNNLDETESEEVNATENINDMLTREMGALQSLYGKPESPLPSPSEERQINRGRSNSFDNAFQGEVQKVEKRKKKFLKRLSNMFRNSVHGTHLSDFPEYNTSFDCGNVLTKSESDTTVPSLHRSLDIPDGECDASVKHIRKSASQDSLDSNKYNRLKTSLQNLTPQTSIEKGSTESLDPKIYEQKEIRPETLKIINDFEQMIQDHLKSHKVDNIWD